MENVKIGQSVLRNEDFRFLTGQGTYIDDIRVDGLTHAAFLRSPHAHATINGIDTSAAEALTGVLAVVTGADWKAEGFGPIPT